MDEAVRRTVRTWLRCSPRKDCIKEIDLWEEYPNEDLYQDELLIVRCAQTMMESWTSASYWNGGEPEL